MSALIALRMSYAAALVASVTYGMYLIIAGMSIRFLLRRHAGRQHEKRWQHQITLWYTVAMLTASTIYYISGASWSEIGFVEATVNPAVLATLLVNPQAICKDVAFTVTIWMADSLIIYRLYGIWLNNVYVVILPLLVFFATVACGLRSLIQVKRPSPQIDLTLPTYALSVGLNVMCTILICYALWKYHRRLQIINHKKSDYSSIAVIFIESAAAYSITGLLYMASAAKHSTWSYPMGALWASVTAIYPQIIILRIALGIDILATSGSIGPSLPSFNRQASSTRIEEGSLQSVGPVADASSDVWMDGKSQRNAAHGIDMKTMNLNDATSEL